MPKNKCYQLIELSQTSGASPPEQAETKLDRSQKKSDDLTLSFSSLKTKEWLRTHEVAAYLGSTVGAIHNLVYRGKLTPKRLPGIKTNFYSRSEIDQLLEMPSKRRK